MLYNYQNIGINYNVSPMFTIYIANENTQLCFMTIFIAFYKVYYRYINIFEK